MRRISRGFTIIEVVLFIGISGFLIIGLIVGTSATIARQRYNDSVQDLAEFFRREYSNVINPQNVRDRNEAIRSTVCEGRTEIDGSEGAYKGRSSCLLYGRLIVLGETLPAATDSEIINVYDVIGSELSQANKSKTLEEGLKLINLTVLIEVKNIIKAIGHSQYRPQWLAQVQSVNLNTRAKMAILIFRSPINGTVNTFVYEGTIEIQTPLKNGTFTTSQAKRILSNLIRDNKFAPREVNLCVGSQDIFAIGSRRRNIRIAINGRNGAAVNLIDQDSEDNQCKV